MHSFLASYFDDDAIFMDGGRRFSFRLDGGLRQDSLCKLFHSGNRFLPQYTVTVTDFPVDAV